MQPSPIAMPENRDPLNENVGFSIIKPSFHCIYPISESRCMNILIDYKGFSENKEEEKRILSEKGKENTKRPITLRVMGHEIRCD